jgi:hypothetical protein
MSEGEAERVVGMPLASAATHGADRGHPRTAARVVVR